MLAALVSAAPAAVAAVDIDGRFALVNESFCELIGRPRRALLGARLDEVVDSGRELAREALECLDDVPRYMFPARAARARRWLNVELKRMRVGGLAAAVGLTDQEESRRLERELARTRSRYERLEALHRVEADAHRDSERRLQFALDAARMGTWTWDPIRDVALHDARAKEILDGVSEEATFQAALEHRLPAEAAERYAHGLARILDPRSDDHQFEEELPWKCRDGSWIWILMTGEAHFEGVGADRRVAFVSGTVVEITERKRNEAAVAEANRRKDRFLATLAHELRNPLAPLYYAVDLLESQSSAEADWARGVIERQVAHLTRLIDDLLDVSRIGRGQLEVRREPILVQDVAQAAIESSRLALREHEQELVIRIPSEPIVVRGDFVRLTQVVTNLLTNAAKFSLRPGEVALRVERDGESSVRLSVEDYGVGIAPEDLPHVFEMFYRGGRSLDRPNGGLGVGLYLVRSLVELHGGTVEVESKGDGRGSIFSVRLPIEREQSKARPAPDARRHGTRRPARKVLIVDDNHDSADALAKLLRAAGDEVVTAYEGLAALDAAERLKPDVVLLDLGMPTIDGYEVCRRIRERPWGRSALMVALTGWGRDEDRERTREVGFDEHLVKPVGVADVESVLRSRLENV